MRLQEIADYKSSLQPDMKHLLELAMRPSGKWSWISERMRAVKEGDGG